MSRLPHRAAAEARALQTALTLAAKADWRFDRGPVPPTPFANYLYVPKAQMLLVPTTSGLPYAKRQVEVVVRQTRSDALIVSRPSAGTPQFAFAAWSRAKTARTWPLALWLSEPGAPWLVPFEPDDIQLGFELVNAVHQSKAVPWVDPIERFAGFGRAIDWLGRTVGGSREGR